MNCLFESLSWTQNGVNNIVKLLPGQRIGTLAKEICDEKKAAGDTVSEKVQAIRDGNVEKVRSLQTIPEGREIATAQLMQWDEYICAPQDTVVPVTLYRQLEPKAMRPCVIYFHGGGWQYGNRTVVQPVCRYLAQQTDALVINTAYRLAPENPWPAGFQDCWAVVCWTYAHAQQLGIDKTRITVAGDSAGGNLAALCSHKDRTEGLNMIEKQVLYYPALAVRDTDGLEDFEFNLENYVYDDSQKHWIEPFIMAIYNAGKRSESNYIPANINTKDSRVSPLWDKSFINLPKTLLITAQYDYLTQQARAYAKKLAQANVPVTMINYCGMVHAFVDKCGIYPQAEDSLNEAADFVVNSNRFAERTVT
ncbi:MAG: alpha/beta hydrolase [Oscillospiraceae bacterium]|nr:alpha/beta hydrolase [Oscillospiraceae bacterium]